MVSAEIRHHIRGRIRLRVGARERDPALLESLRKILAAAPGVHSVELNPAAACAVIRYEPSLYDEFPKMLADVGEREKLFRLELSSDGGGVPDRSWSDAALDDVLGRANRTIQKSTANLVSMKEMLPAGIALSALLFVDRAAAAAQWLSWIQFAWSSYFDLHQTEPVQEVSREVRALHNEIAEIRRLLEQRLES
jgi:hypothetical protein